MPAGHVRGGGARRVTNGKVSDSRARKVYIDRTPSTKDGGGTLVPLSPTDIEETEEIQEVAAEPDSAEEENNETTEPDSAFK